MILSSIERSIEMKVTHLAKKAAVIGSTLLTVLTAEANPSQKPDAGLSYTNAPSAKQVEESPRRRFLRRFIYGAASDLGFGAANPMINAALGGSSEFAIRPPNTNLNGKAAVTEQKPTQREAKKVTTQTVKTPVGRVKTTEHE